VTKDVRSSSRLVLFCLVELLEGSSFLATFVSGSQRGVRVWISFALFLKLLVGRCVSRCHCYYFLDYDLDPARYPPFCIAQQFGLHIARFLWRRLMHNSLVRYRKIPSYHDVMIPYQVDCVSVKWSNAKRSPRRSTDLPSRYHDSDLGPV